jgi:hypothetical protein
VKIAGSIGMSNRASTAVDVIEATVRVSVTPSMPVEGTKSVAQTVKRMYFMEAVVVTV